MIVGSPLFRNRDLDGYLRGQVGAINDYVRDKVKKSDLEKADAEIAQGMLTEARVNPLIVDFENPAKQVSEARVQVNDMFHGRVTIDGVRATRSFSFTGDDNLFNLQTNPFTMVLPYAVVSSNRVTIGVEGRNDPEALKREIDNQEQTLRQYVSWSKAQVDAHNNRLEGLLVDAISRRRAHLTSLDDLAGKI